VEAAVAERRSASATVHFQYARQRSSPQVEPNALSERSEGPPDFAASPVSVVVPTRNRSRALLDVLGSILAQQGVVVPQVVVVDEASTDSTPAVLSVAAARDHRVVVVRHDIALGPAAARNTGLAAVTSPYVAFCDDDDLWAPHKLALQLRALEAVPEAAWSCAGAVNIDDSNRVLAAHHPPRSGSVLEQLLRENIIPAGGSGVVVETALIRRVGGFDESLRGVEDWDAWLRLAQASPIASVDRPLIGYRVAASSISHHTDAMVHNLDLITERWGPGTEHGRANYLARQALHRRDRREAARLFWHSFLQTRQLRDVVGLAAAATLPSAYDGLRRRAMSPTYKAEGQSWLSELRALELTLPTSDS
jgi:glycosyltransferase involved in cell wall biosynthesis